VFLQIKIKTNKNEETKNAATTNPTRAKNETQLQSFIVTIIIIVSYIKRTTTPTINQNKTNKLKLKKPGWLTG